MTDDATRAPFDPGPPSVHPKAEVDASVQLGPGTRVWAFSVVMAGVRTGANCSIATGCYVGVGTVLGDNVRLQDKCHITDHMTIGSNVFFGPMVVTMNDRHPVVNNPFYKREPPIIEDDVSVGAGAVILPGVRLGRGCVIGAGAVVTKDIPPYKTVMGVPAREHGTGGPR